MDPNLERFVGQNFYVQNKYRTTYNNITLSGDNLFFKEMTHGNSSLNYFLITLFLKNQFYPIFQIKTYF